MTLANPDPDAPIGALARPGLFSSTSQDPSAGAVAYRWDSVAVEIVAYGEPDDPNAVPIRPEAPPSDAAHADQVSPTVSLHGRCSWSLAIVACNDDEWSVTAMRNRVGLLGGCALSLILAGCAASPSPVPHAKESSAPTVTTCAVTAPTTDGIPPAIMSQQYPAVYNEGDLWVGAWWTDPASLKQARSAEDSDSRYPYGQKYPSWTVNDGEVTSVGGAPRVTVKRLDGNDHGSSSVGGLSSATLADGTVARWYPTVVRFTTHGCWQVTETVGVQSLAYVVKL